MAEDFGKLSPEQIKAFSKTVKDLKNLPARQEEIIEKVLAGEIDIGKQRIAYLEEFFDVYSRNLDLIARKQSALTDGFLILEDIVDKTSDNFQEAAGKIAESFKDAGESVSRSAEASSNNSSKNDNNNANKKEPVVEESIVSDDKLDQMDKPQPQTDFADQVAEFFRQEQEARRNEVTDQDGGPVKQVDIAARKQKQLDDLHESHLERRTALENTLKDLEIARYERAKGSELQLAHLTDLRLSKQQEAASAELAAQDLINNINTEIDYATSENYTDGKNDLGYNEAGETRSRQVNANENEQSIRELNEKRLKWIAEQELKSKRKNNGILEKEEATRIQREAAKKFKFEEDALKKLTKIRQYEQDKELRDKEKAEKRQAQAKGDELLGTLTGKGQTLKDRIDAFKDLTTNAETGKTDIKAVVGVAVKALSNFAKNLENTIEDIASYKSDIDTRLQGSSNKTSSGSYWDQITKDIMSVGAINPYFKQEDFSKNIKSLVDEGIAFDLEQRAFLMTIQSKIANTFEVADGTLLRLIRIQQEDSTAGRLGMESALNSFLNNMYENTEYLKSVADSVRGSLEEMQSLMSGAEATEVEYQVQKWLGSLYSVGMSQNAVQGISNALGQIAAGQIEGLTSGGAGNLLIMAANDAGLSIADILTDGINSSDTNKLLQAAVNYLAELSDSAKDNKVVQQQLADVFGVKASDLKAATNLVLPGSTESIFNNSMTYNNMLYQLSEMAGTMGKRTSLGEMMTNMWSNTNYTLASGIASNPVAYAIYKVAGLLDDTVGGIPFPDISIMGNTVALNTTIADIMRVAAMSGGMLTSMGSLIAGLGNSFSGQKMLSQLGIESGSGLTITPRGDGNLLKMAGGGESSVSESGYVGNASSSDIKNSTIQETKDSNKKQMIEAQEEAEANQVDVLNTTVLKIYELLDDVAHGNSYFRVKVDDYGLTKTNSSGAQGGVASLDGSNSSSGGTSSSGSSYSGSNGISGNVSLGGWTTTV